MTVRIRLGEGPTIRPRRVSKRRYAQGLAAFLTPAIVMASVLAFWRILADLSVTSEFAISSGLFSHWQVWVGMAFVLHLAKIRLDRYGRGDGDHTALS
jgi:hypothetical protein